MTPDMGRVIIETGYINSLLGVFSSMNDDILKVENICKSFSTVEVLHNISFGIRRGDILGIIGDEDPDRNLSSYIGSDLF